MIFFVLLCDANVKGAYREMKGVWETLKGKLIKRPILLYCESKRQLNTESLKSKYKGSRLEILDKLDKEHIEEVGGCHDFFRTSFLLFLETRRFIGAQQK
jgi:hypothetical protein